MPLFSHVRKKHFLIMRLKCSILCPEIHVVYLPGIEQKQNYAIEYQFGLYVCAFFLRNENNIKQHFSSFNFNFLGSFFNKYSAHILHQISQTLKFEPTKHHANMSR